MMFKKIFVSTVLFILILSFGVAYAATLVIDDFEDGNISSAPKWWTFDKASIKVDKVTGKGDGLGKKAAVLSGSTTNWYIGGLGTYLGIDGTKYNALQIKVKGEGPMSGQLKIELFDDDNKNWDAEQDSKKGWIAKYDDTWVYILAVDGAEWKDIVIPFSDFKDSNPGVGNDKLDLNQADGSGGLLQISLIVLSSGEKGKANIAIDSLKLIKQ